MSTKKRISQRVFIVGCPRSGTTLLQGMVGAHPRIKTFPETHFFSIAFPESRLKGWLTWPALNVQGVLEEFLTEIGCHDLLEEAKINLFARNYEERYIDILDKITLEDGKNIWVEKTPRHLHFTTVISERVPDSKFLHIVRDGTDVVASLYKITNENPRAWTKGRRPGFRGFSVEECIQRWNHDVKISARHMNCPGHLVVRFETLVDDPESSLREITDFLNISYVPAMLTPERMFEQIVGRDEEAWKANNARPISQPRSKFDEIFSAETQRLIRERLVEIDF